jgi:hypothetical protein
MIHSRGSRDGPGVTKAQIRAAIVFVVLVLALFALLVYVGGK